MPEHQTNVILNPDEVDDVSDEKKEYYASQGYVPYRMGDSHVKWAQKDRAIRDIQAYRYRHEPHSPIHEFKQYYINCRKNHNSVVSCLLALLRFLAESR